MATSESKGELVIPITVVQSSVLLRRPFVPAIVHVEHRRVTVNLTTSAKLEPVEKKNCPVIETVQIVMIFFQKLIVVLHWKMVVKIAGMDAARTKESVTGVEQTVIAAEKIGLGKVAMVKLEDLGIINVYLNLQMLD